MPFEIIGTPQVKEITPDLARYFSNKLKRVPGERPLSKDRVNGILDKIAEGQQIVFEWAEALCNEDGEIYRVNGQNSSFAICSLDSDDWPANLYASVTEYYCETFADLGELYAQFDNPERSRTSGNINQIVACSVKDLKGMRTRVIDVAVTGMEFSESEGKNSRLDRYERAERLRLNEDFVKWLDFIFCGPSPDWEHLKRGPVVAAMFLTYKRSKPLATEFWSEIRDSGSEKGTPQAKLRDYLIRSRVRGSATGAVGASPREMFVKCLVAWNAWRKGTTTSLKYFPENDAPKVV